MITTNGFHRQISVNDLDAGTYLLRMQYDKQIMAKRFIKI